MDNLFSGFLATPIRGFFHGRSAMQSHRIILKFKIKPKHQVIEHFAGFRSTTKAWINPKPESESSFPGKRTDKETKLEALLFLADEPIPSKKIAAACGLSSTSEARKTLKELQKKLVADHSSFQVEEVAGGFQLFTLSEFHPWLSRINARSAEGDLSSAMKETLSIIAYRQPITRADLEKIRGVNVSEILRGLLEKSLIRICGRENTLGRPVLYGTTKKFLLIHGFKSIKDLPKYKELARQEPNELMEPIPDPDSTS